ncbi:uncharacterized protein LOC121749234 [Salvia splendens]|uniref:uncharacterized protein LOC121749234 n=1 Tax=Salvia splendens TaxID=180675 RepID=UPI001C26E99C|nr:uncharacterized protein LOC121749234 [Salvia splendens]
MDKYLNKRPRVSIGSSSANVEQEPQQLGNNVAVENNQDEIEIDKEKIKADPGLRDPIDSFDVNIRDRIRREYVAKGPCQPKGHDFPKKHMGKIREVLGMFAPGDEAFVGGGFSNWKKANERFTAHVGSTGSAHHKARIEYENFVNQKQSVPYIVSRVGSKQEKEYRIRLTATLDVIRFLLNQGLAFRGHDETSTSSNRGNFLELLYWYSLRNDEVGQVVLKNAPGNNQMIAPSVQKDIVNACAVETTLEIMKELGDGLFSIMVDESRDCSVKEQMAIVYVDLLAKGQINSDKLNMKEWLKGLRKGKSLQVVDLISQEMRNRFSESSTDLLECMACLDPRNHFSNFNVDKLVHLATLYPEDFSSMELNLLTKQLQSFVSDVRRDTRFSDVEDLGTLSKKMVETMKDKIFQLVYRLIKLVLLLLVATSSVERVFSAMKFVKSELRNRMGDDWLNDSLTVYSENEVFATIPNERILSRFQKMDTRRSQLSRIA